MMRERARVAETPRSVERAKFVEKTTIAVRANVPETPRSVERAKQIETTMKIEQQMTQADLIALLERCLLFIEAWEKECGNTELGNDLRAALDDLEMGES